MLISPPPDPSDPSLPHAATPNTATTDVQDNTVILRSALRSLLIWLPRFSGTGESVHVYASRATRVAILDPNLRTRTANDVNILAVDAFDRKHS